MTCLVSVVNNSVMPSEIILQLCIYYDMLGDIRIMAIKVVNEVSNRFPSGSSCHYSALRI